MANVEPGVVISIRDLVVGFGNQIVLDPCRSMYGAVRFSAWSVHLAEANQFCFAQSSV